MSDYKRDDVKKEIVRIVADVLDIDPDEVTEEKELDGDLKIDSLALYEIVVEIEEFYSLRISNDEADDLSTVGEAIDFICNRIKSS